MTETTVKKDKPEYGTVENIAYLIKNIWKWDKVLFLMALIKIPVNVFIPLLGIYLPKVLVDSVSNKVGVSQLIVDLSLPIMGIVVFTVISSVTGAIIQGRAGANRMSYMELLAKKIIDTDYENIDGAEGQTRLTKATMSMYSNHSATQAIAGTGVEFLSNIIGFILYAGIISTLHPIIVGFILLSSIINYYVGRYVNKYEHKNKDNLAPIEKKLNYIRVKTGDFKFAKDMRLYNMSGWFKDMYSIYLKERGHFLGKNILRRYLSNIIDGLLIFLRDGIAYGFLIYSVLYREMPIGDFILYFGAIAGFSTWLSGIVKNLNSLNSISLNVTDLRDYLEMEDKMNRGIGVGLPGTDEMPCEIELKSLYYKYPGAEDYTIENINLHIKKGEKLALVGVNGAGKTTLVKLICGLYRPSKGEIYINGKKSSDYNRDEYYSMFSVVFQDSHVLPMSIGKNISSQLEEYLDDEKMDRVLNQSDFMGKVESLPKGKDTLLVKSLSEEAIELSGGEMQKLMLARALYKSGPIIILDEPTAALDPIAENEIYEKYNELTKEHTSMFISHRLSSTRFCDRIIFLQDGQIIEEGNHNDLMKKNGKYKEMYDMQSHYYQDDIGGGEDE